MNGGSISDNTATNGYHGGGVNIEGGLFTMNGGAISGNTTSGTAPGEGVGGGVYNNGGALRMTNGIIVGSTDYLTYTKNTAPKDGAALYIFYLNNGTAACGPATSTPPGTGTTLLTPGNGENNTIRVVNGVKQ